MIKCENLSLLFKEQNVYDDLSFHIELGESVCVKAASGKGKSSLLKMIMGLLQPSSGRIFIKGLELCPQHINTIRNLISWLPQNVYLPVNSSQELIDLLMLNADNVSLYNNCLQQLEITEEHKLKDFSELSGGEKQRILLAACISMQKPILLLDEPVSALDDHSIDLLLALLDNLKDKTILSTSHNQKWISHCDRILDL